MFISFHEFKRLALTNKSLPNQFKTDWKIKRTKHSKSVIYIEKYFLYLGTIWKFDENKRLSILCKREENLIYSKSKVQRVSIWLWNVQQIWGNTPPFFYCTITSLVTNKPSKLLVSQLNLKRWSYELAFL